MNIVHAVIAAGLLIATAIFFRPAAPQPQFQIAHFNDNIIARLNTKTGALDLCGRIITIPDLIRYPLPTGDEFFSEDPAIQKQLNDLKLKIYNLALLDRCIALNNGPEGLR